MLIAYVFRKFFTALEGQSSLLMVQPDSTSDRTILVRHYTSRCSSWFVVIFLFSSISLVKLFEVTCLHLHVCSFILTLGQTGALRTLTLYTLIYINAFCLSSLLNPLVIIVVFCMIIIIISVVIVISIVIIFIIIINRSTSGVERTGLFYQLAVGGLPTMISGTVSSHLD